MLQEVTLNITTLLKQSSLYSPEFVVSLNATDVFLKSRVLNLPESLVEGTSYSPEQFPQRLARFRERNVEDETLLNYFEDLEIHPEHFGNLERPDVNVF